MQGRIYCDVFNKSVIPNSYPNHLKSEGPVNIVLRNQCTNSMIKKHIIGKYEWEQN